LAKRLKTTPKRKGLKRTARLKAAKIWMEAYQGMNVVKGYSKYFGVDLLCAIKELQALKVQLDPDYINRIILGEQAKQQRKMEEERELIEQDDYFYYIAGYTPNGAAFGTTWEEHEKALLEERAADSIAFEDDFYFVAGYREDG